MSEVRFFVTGHGRSGTTWLARVLNRDRSVRVHHEPLPVHDRHWYARCYRGEREARDWLARRRDKMARIQARHPDGEDYAEVNSYLRYVVPSLWEAFPGASVAAVIRDGRATVRSLAALGCYHRPNYPEIPPLPELADAEPLAQCCGYWAHTYRKLVEAGVPVWRLEDLNADYGAFGRLCEWLGVDVSREQWQQHAGRPVNVGTYTGHLRAWDEGWESVFRECAGDVQEAFYL